MLKRVIALFISIIMLLLLTGCLATSAGKHESGIDKDQIKVYTTFYTLYDLTKKIGGNKVQVSNLVPAGIEPHDWEPTPRVIAGMGEVDILVYNGAGMERWVEKIINSLDNSRLIVVETSKGLPVIKGDPHIWLDPTLALKQAEKIKETLIKADIKNKNYYEKNYIKLAQRIQELDKKYEDTLDMAEKKDFIVSHNAFGYLARRYGLNQVPLTGLSAEGEPTPAKLAEIADLCREKNIKFIFFEELVSPKIAETLAREVGARTLVLNPLEGLTPEELKRGEDYFSIMEKNLENLKKALVDY